MPQDRYWKAVVREDLISSEAFCTRSEASISHLDVEGHESLASMCFAYGGSYQTGPWLQAQSFSENVCPHQGSVIFTLPETLSTGKKKSGSFDSTCEINSRMKTMAQKGCGYFIAKE